MTQLWIPAARLRNVIERHPNPSAALAGKNCERTFRAVMAGSRTFVSLRAADSILTKLDLHDWWHIPLADGGLADIYVDEKQYGKPDTHPVRPSKVPRYDTEAERVAARRATWRRYRQRQRAELAAA